MGWGAAWKWKTQPGAPHATRIPASAQTQEELQALIDGRLGSGDERIRAWQRAHPEVNTYEEGTSLRPPRLRGETIMTDLAHDLRYAPVPRVGNHRRGAEHAETRITRVVLNHRDVSAPSAPPR